MRSSRAESSSCPCAPGRREGALAPTIIATTAMRETAILPRCRGLPGSARRAHMPCLFARCWTDTGNESDRARTDSEADHVAGEVRETVPCNVSLSVVGCGHSARRKP